MASAQDWTPSNVSAGTYYIYNVGADQFLCSGNNWGSHASVAKGGIPLTLSGSGNSYAISTAHIFANHYLAGDGWMDGGSFNWTFEEVSNGVYKLKNGSNVLYWNGGTSTNTTIGGDPGTTASQWKLVTEEARIAALSNATEDKPIDATFLIKNAYFAKGNGRIVAKGADLTNSPSWKGTTLTDLWGYDSGNEDACYAVEQYGKQFDNYQILTVPNGKYFMTAKGFYRGSVAPYIYANSEKCNLKVKGDIGGDNITNGAKAMVGNDYLLDGVTVTVTDGTLRVGVKSDAWMEWCVFDDFQLVYYGVPGVSEAKKDLDAKAEQAQAIVSRAEATPGAIAALNAAISAAQSVEMTEEAIQTAMANLIAAMDVANATIAPYASLKALKETCITYAAESYSNVETESVRTDFNTAINTATTEGDAATTIDVLNSVYNTLDKARQEYTKLAIPTTGNNFDMTFLMTNPQVTSATGWTNGGTANSQQYTGAPDNTYLDFYQVTRDMHQVVPGLPAGTYYVKAATRAHADVPVGYIYVQNGENKVQQDVHKAGNSGNTLGNGWDWTTTNAVAVTDGQLTIGFYAECGTGQWVGADNFSLYRTYDESLIAPVQASIATLKTDAQKYVGKKMATEVAASLTAAIDYADANSTDPFALNRMVVDLSSAIADAEKSIAEYEKILSYIEKANGISESIASEYKIGYENGTITESAEIVFQNLEVATYNYVTTNFTYAVGLGTWNSTGTNTEAAEFINTEHWSGEAKPFMNQKDSWGNPPMGYAAESWSLDFDQEIKLPAGEYIFKVAGRKSADAILQLEVKQGETTLGTVNDFPSTNEALGINKAGATSFDPEDPAGFAREGAGWGWQWRYVRFELDAETTVKIAVHAETSAKSNWVSFADYTLQMTEETYMAAGQPEFDAALAAAQELVGTKPMGTAEETALNAAINLPVNTGADQKAKVNALNTAVEKIKAWRAIYYAEKDKLVAALERFEADYNDADNGALNHMNKNRWATVIEKAQAAALAKDNQSSYEGFETAANELTEALDAATVSVNEYAALKSAIDEANTLVAANVGDFPFERPQSAADAISTTEEQILYDAATADGEGVTSVTDALNTGIAKFKDVPLNAPKDGARYNLVMNNNGNWEHDGKAVAYLANDRVDAGLYNIQYLTAPNANYAQAFTLTAVEGKQDCYYLSMTDVEGNERYVCTGVVYGGNASQLRTTTKVEDALAVKVIATTIEGVHNLYNTAANDYIGGQDAGFFTVNSHINFNIREAAKAEVAMNISAAKWSTLILPFNAALPEGVKAYSCNEADVETETLTLTEATTLKANTPYLINGEAGTHEFSGYGLAKQDTYAAGIFTGTYVDYHTTANSGTYVLQKHDNVLAFYLVGESAQPWVRAYRCYITFDNASTARMFSFGFDNETTGIDNAQLSTGDSELIIFDIMGRKVTSMKKGNLYIINGKKVLVK